MEQEPIHERTRETPVRGPAPTPAPRAPKTVRLDRLFLSRHGELTWDQMTSFRGGSRREGHELMFWSWLALFIDGLVLISLSSFFVLVFAVLMRSPLGDVVRFLAAYGLGPIFTMCFAVSAWLYMVTMRVMFGFSLGEWACDLRLGQPTQRMKSGYALRVVLRATLVLASGFVLLPLLSLLIGRDVAGKLSGVEVISLK